MPPTLSPTVLRMRAALAQRFPKARVHTWSAVSDSNAREGARIAFGEPVDDALRVRPGTRHRLARQRLPADRDRATSARRKLFAAGRRLRSAQRPMSRLYVVEPSPTTTGDERRPPPAPPGERRSRGTPTRSPPSSRSTAVEPRRPATARRPKRGERRGHRAQVARRGRQGPRARTAAARSSSSARASRRGSTRSPTRSTRRSARAGTSCHYATATDADELDVDDRHARRSPTPSAPGRSTRSSSSAATRSTTRRPTSGSATSSRRCPSACTRRSSSTRRARSAPGTCRAPTSSRRGATPARSTATSRAAAAHRAALRRPQRHRAPRAHGEFGGATRDTTRFVRTARDRRGARPTTLRLRALRRRQGRVPRPAGRTGARQRDGPRPRMEPRARVRLGSPRQAPPSRRPTLRRDAVAAAIEKARGASRRPRAPRGHLRALPEDGRRRATRTTPGSRSCRTRVTKIVWDNAAIVSPATREGARRRRTRTSSRSRVGDRSITAAVWIVPGQADNSIALTLGWGRTKAGRIGNGRGFDVYPLRTTDALGFAVGATVAKTGDEPYFFAQTQEHNSTEGRPIAHEATLAEYKRAPELRRARRRPRSARCRSGRQAGLQQGPPVGHGDRPERVHRLQRLRHRLHGREQHARRRQDRGLARPRDALAPHRPLLRRATRSIGATAEDPLAIHEPLVCVHCEEAPCENVCPVNATDARPRGAERDGLQPLHRHALLRATTARTRSAASTT